MTTIHVHASRAYDVLVGNKLLNHGGDWIRQVTRAEKCLIVSDSNVYPLHGVQLQTCLANSGFSVCAPFIFAAGEQSKTGATYLSLLNHLAQCSITRADCIVALGGGVVGDLTGFAAATFLRGIDYIQIPTTLLAAVDSSVGGKTAIDLDSGKNLAGAFYQPRLVLCDLDTLNTLPVSIFRDGCAEVIKYGVLYDANLFSHLQETGLNFDRSRVVARCIELKRDVVATDEFDRGQRMLLNLGHTIGHGVEAASGYTVSHGSAVAIGMAMISRAAARMGICREADAQAIVDTLKYFGLETAGAYTPDALLPHCLSDKKRSADTVSLIVPERIGACRILPTPAAQLRAVIEAGY